MRYTLEQARMLTSKTQQEMADDMGMSVKTYIQYEKYRRVFRMDQGYKFSQSVDVPFDSIIFFAGQLQNFCTLREKQASY